MLVRGQKGKLPGRGAEEQWFGASNAFQLTNTFLVLRP